MKPSHNPSRNPPTLLLTGAGGQLGLTLQAMWPKHPAGAEFHLHPMPRNKLDITDEAAVLNAVKQTAPALIINAAADNAVDKAEVEPEQAMLTNATGVRNLARAAQATGARLIHISTAYVFDGRGARPYTIDDHPNPVGAYAKSKRAGEQALYEAASALEATPEQTAIQTGNPLEATSEQATEQAGNPLEPASEQPAQSKAATASVPSQWAIVRTSWLYSPYRTNFVKTILHLLEEKPELQVVNDQTGSPTSTRTLGECLLRLAGKMMREAEPISPAVPNSTTKPKPKPKPAADMNPPAAAAATPKMKPKKGSSAESPAPIAIYHWVDSGAVTWFDFAVAIQQEALAAGLLSKRIPIHPVTTAEYQPHTRQAPRPAYGVLDTSRAEAELNLTPTPWRDELKQVLTAIQRNPR